MGRSWGSLENRFWARILKKDGCWEWSGHKCPRGYGRLTQGGGSKKIVLAHRLSYEIHSGQIPKGLFVCHRCDNPQCCNPSHLFLGTASDNNKDAKSKGRSRGVRGESQPKSKLTRDDVAEIRASGLTQDRLAKTYGVSQSAISLAKRSINWAWLN